MYGGSKTSRIFGVVLTEKNYGFSSMKMVRKKISVLKTAKLSGKSGSNFFRRVFVRFAVSSGKNLFFSASCWWR